MPSDANRTISEQLRLHAALYATAGEGGRTEELLTQAAEEIERLWDRLHGHDCINEAHVLRAEVDRLRGELSKFRIHNLEGYPHE